MRSVTANLFGVARLEDKDISKEGMDQLRQSWSGVPSAICSLIYAISGGDDWGTLSEPFWEMHNVHGLIFMSYVLFITFGLLNILVGVFVQEANSLSDWDQDVVLTGDRKSVV